jgi:hypothetical protein
MTDIATIARFPEVKKVVRTDRQGTLIDSIREPDPEGVGAVAGFVVGALTQAGDQLGLGTLRRIVATGPRCADLAAVNDRTVILLRIEPASAVAAAEKALDASPQGRK